MHIKTAIHNELARLRGLATSAEGSVAEELNRSVARLEALLGTALPRTVHTGLEVVHLGEELYDHRADIRAAGEEVENVVTAITPQNFVESIGRIGGILTASAAKLETATPDAVQN